MARGTTEMDDHHDRIRTENAMWLMSAPGGALALDAAARRLGLKTNTLEKHLDRHCPGWLAECANAYRPQRAKANA